MNYFFNKYLITFIILSLIILGALGACGQDLNKKVAESETEATVAAVDLVNEYDDDLDLANQKYKHKIIEVTGTVSEVELEEIEYDMIYINLLGQEEPPQIYEVPVFRVRCYFSPEKKFILSHFKPGRKITIKGLSEGLLVYPVLMGCQIVDVLN